MNRLLTRLPSKVHNLIFNVTGWLLVEFIDEGRLEWHHRAEHDWRSLWRR